MSSNKHSLLVRPPILPSSLVILLRRVSNVSVLKMLLNTNSFLGLESRVIFFGKNTTVNFTVQTDSLYCPDILMISSEKTDCRNFLQMPMNTESV
jgi:hypothetical protein